VATGVIFDMDGVLVDSAAAHQRAWQQLGEEIGTPFSAARFRATFGQTNASIIPAWLGVVAAPRFRELDRHKEELYRGFVRQGAIRIYARIPELLVELRQRRMRVAIASSGPRENVTLLIDTIGAHDVVDAVVSAEDVRAGKPDPQVFLSAAERLGLTAAACAVIEDSVHGIEAAKCAGMLAIAVLTSTPRARLAAAGADVLVGEVGCLQAAQLCGLIEARLCSPGNASS